MRTGYISIDGQRHTLCFSVRVIRLCAERYGAVSGLFEALSGEDEVKALDESLWILSEMMKAGDKYCKEHGLENAAPLSVDALMDTCDIGDFYNIKASIVVTVNNGKKTRVEADSPNA